MSGRDLLDGEILQSLALSGAPDRAKSPGRAHRRFGLLTGELVAIIESGQIPLVALSGDGDVPAVQARSLVDLDHRHVGASLALLLEEGDPARPVVIGILQCAPAWPLEDPPGHVQLEAGGRRLIVSARQSLVLRCGKSSITLASNGQIEIRGQSILAQAVRANRIRGGSVELN